MEAVQAGGTYSGTGVSSNSFDPSTAGVGTHKIYYTYTDGNGCTNVDSTDQVVNGQPTVTLSSSFSAVCSNSGLSHLKQAVAQVVEPTLVTTLAQVSSTP